MSVPSIAVDVEVDLYPVMVVCRASCGVIWLLVECFQRIPVLSRFRRRERLVVLTHAPRLAIRSDVVGGSLVKAATLARVPGLNLTIRVATIDWLFTGVARLASVQHPVAAAGGGNSRR